MNIYNSVKSLQHIILVVNVIKPVTILAFKEILSKTKFLMVIAIFVKKNGHAN